MGTYYQVACDEKKERIDPGEINDLGIKSGPIANPKHPFGAVVIFAMLHRWRAPVRLVNDCAEDAGYFEYANVTEETLKAYNEFYGMSLKFTGEKLKQESTFSCSDSINELSRLTCKICKKWNIYCQCKENPYRRCVRCKFYDPIPLVDGEGHCMQDPVDTVGVSEWQSCDEFKSKQFQ